MIIRKGGYIIMETYVEMKARQTQETRVIGADPVEGLL